MNFNKHPYHLVDISPWPILSAVSGFFLTRGLVLWFHFNLNVILLRGLILLILNIYHWWQDVIRERTFQGIHTKFVNSNIRWGIILFIISEIFFFVSFFWAFFHFSLSPDISIGSYWPPESLEIFEPFEVPLLNTVILLSSGCSITWAHHALINEKFKKTRFALLITILWAIIFTGLQAMEYIQASFTIADSRYGAIFFIATGFHGTHVIIGSLFLIVILLRINKIQFSRKHHFGFEAAAWYWHYVDVVWLFLFTSIYWWRKY